jgi:hypothetical protein
VSAPPPTPPPGLDPEALARARAAHAARHPRPPGFSPRFTLSLFYVAALVVGYALVLALPDLVAGARSLPPGSAELTPAELARAQEIAHGAVTGRLHYALGAALATFGLLVWRGWLPGVGSRS